MILADTRLQFAIADELDLALLSRRVIEPLTDRYPDLTVDDAYAISRRLLERRLSRGERLLGKKIGVTSMSVQAMLGVYQPDFGFLTDAMLVAVGGSVRVSDRLIQPRAEGEIAFRLARELRGPGVSAQDVAGAIDSAMPCVEIVDSRIRDWRIQIVDTVADNASCGLFVLGAPISPNGLDLAAVGCVMRRNGDVVGRGVGREALGSPLSSVAWLANTLSAYDIALLPGEIVLSGSLVPLEPVSAGDVIHVALGQLGSLEVRFT